VGGHGEGGAGSEEQGAESDQAARRNSVARR
jgi:hypothetical protein